MHTGSAIKHTRIQRTTHAGDPKDVEENEECLSIVARAVPLDASTSPEKTRFGGTPTVSPEKAVKAGRGAAV
jgi:hypothetical protein